MIKSIRISNRITNREGSFKQYLNEISEIGVFTPEEEYECAKRASDGDEEAIEELIKHNLRFVVSVAKQYENQNVTLEDLVNEGNIGLILAVQNYKPSTGFKFITYAVWWIRKLILEYLGKNSKMIRLPANRVNEISKYNQEINKLEQKYGRNIGAFELLDELSEGKTDDEILELSKDISQLETIVSFKLDSLDCPVNEDSEISFYEKLSDTKIKSTDFLVNEADLKSRINLALNILKPRDREIMVRIFGLNGHEEMPLKDIGEDFGLTTEMIRQIKIKSLKKIKNMFV
jgi:RNA polymerase primary sigma factor